MGGSIDPIEYDVAELRELARVRGDRYVADGFLWLERPASHPPAEETAEYDRPSTWTGSLEERQKPYLRRIPDDERGHRIVREWVQGLVDRAGSDAAVEALSYYESLGWITEAVRDELEGYLLAVGYRPGGSLEDLSRADHVESLARTARLAQMVDADAREERERPGGERADDRPDERPADDAREESPDSFGDRWPDAAVSDARPPNGSDGGGSSAGDGEDPGFEFGPRTE